ncbi:unnamed protein product [Penicillium nalgiovense]|uniref:Uncharacterized protein n=1 Tax=Penicillium nalgiovense TaxID=60175 RepID=A0A9W4HKP8_PENNA|nr:unnamed protein product [Penicillium nalgiovense]CAG7961202.1 unnamed protein product [Penicillium nalgiovense]CAG7971713.1 unnamed protein product [Penicillium nalgiovense]CAG7990136.1 unnamed protein product [Penicillium nalgiovense]CAG8001838.1 unnamed protein product [Penicillium nalgiovense]
METTNYLSLPAVAEFINAYEDKPTAENVKIMVSGILTYAFDSNDGWVLKWQEDEENNQSNCFIVRAIGEERSLHTIVKVIHDKSAPIQDDWDRSVPRLLSAPLPNERCWAILIRGLKVRLYEYHRDQDPEHRLVPCDFKVKDKMKQTVHIHKNADAVNNILTGIPSQVPQPLDEYEHGSMTPNDSTTDDTNGSKVSLSATLENTPASGAYVESSSEDPPTEVNEDKTPTQAEPVTEPEAAAQTKTATQVDTTTRQTKRTAEANGTQAKTIPQAGITPQAKAAAGLKSGTPANVASQVKPAAGVKDATQTKASLLTKGVSGVKLTPKPKPATGVQGLGQTATD